MKFFHLTPVRELESVMRDGLDPARSRSSLPAVFLAGSTFTAQNHEGMKQEPCVLLEVDLPPHLLDSLSPDNVELRDLMADMDEEDLTGHGLWAGAQWSDCNWQQSLAICDQVACSAKIPGHCLTVVPPAFELPTQADIVHLLENHPLIGLRENVLRCFLVGGFAKEALGQGQTSSQSDVDVLLEIAQKPGDSELPEKAEDIEVAHRQKIMNHFVKHRLFGRHDHLHPQWCGRRVDVYFTFDADAEQRPKVQLESPAPKKTARP
jgi:hypothetical protein